MWIYSSSRVFWSYTISCCPFLLGRYLESGKLSGWVNNQKSTCREVGLPAWFPDRIYAKAVSGVINRFSISPSRVRGYCQQGTRNSFLLKNLPVRTTNLLQFIGLSLYQVYLWYNRRGIVDITGYHIYPNWTGGLLSVLPKNTIMV